MSDLQCLWNWLRLDHEPLNVNEKEGRKRYVMSPDLEITVVCCIHAAGQAIPHLLSLFSYLWGIAWPAALTCLRAPEVKLGWWSVPQDSRNSTQVRLWQSTSFHQSCFAEAWFRATLPIVLLPDSDLILIRRLLLMTFRGPYNPKRQYICIHSWRKR